VATDKSGSTVCRSEEKQTTEMIKLIKKATPPSDGVGRRCQRSAEGWETQLHRTAKRRTAGMNRIVNTPATTESNDKRSQLDIRRVLKIVDHILDCCPQVFAGAITKQRVNFPQVGHALLHVFESFFIGLGVWDMTDF
jgi:hypothetical protein